MHRTRRYAFLLLLLAALLPAVATANVPSDYQFSVSSGNGYTPLTTGTEVISHVPANTGPFNDNLARGPFAIGFPFVFDCEVYNNFTINSAGMLVLGNQINASNDNDFATVATYPVIAPYWDHQHYWSNTGCISPTPGVFYEVTGSAPNRVLVVEWRAQYWMSATGQYWSFSCSATSPAQPMFSYQVRLFEGTNKIEFTYGYMFNYGGYNGSATIGIAGGPSNFLSVTPTSSTSASVGTSSNNSIDMVALQIASGVKYTFTPCYAQITGRTGPTDGGTASMLSGDRLMSDVSIYFGQTATRTPMDLSMAAASCLTHTLQLSITGPGAADYFFGTPGVQTTTMPIIGSGPIVTPAISFQPTAVGVREATLTLRDLSNSCVRVYTLAAQGRRRVDLFGNVPQGGTEDMSDGDTLLLNAFTQTGTCIARLPMWAKNTSPSGPANVTFTLTGSDYSLSPTSASLMPGDSIMPTINFCPSDTGPRPGTLTVTADGVSTVFLLRGFGAYPAAQFSTDGVAIDSTGELYRMQGGCVGEEMVSYPIDVSTIGGMTFSINSIEVYELDTNIHQGQPRYVLSRDARGRLIPASDYLITPQPAVLPREANPVLPTPFTVPIGTSRFYLTLITSRPNKRYARIFIRTDALNLKGSDTNDMLSNGLLWFDLYGRGQGGILTDGTLLRGAPKSTVFPPTDVGDSSVAWVTLANTGTCDLTIDSTHMRITSEDVHEFTLMPLPSTWVTDGVGRYHIAPGTTASFPVLFHPIRTGHRRASVYLETNDSSLIQPDNKRGAYYLDLVGNGSAELGVENLTIDAEEIGNATAPFQHGIMDVTNYSLSDITITGIIWEGVDVADFKEMAWPTFPLTIPVTGSLPLDISFQPMGGTPGIREATVAIITAKDDTIRATVRGEAGTRTVSATPAAVTFPTIRKGRIARKAVVITNSGTLPAEIDQPILGGARPSAYQLSPMPRHTLAPGQSEILEVTYLPDTIGALAAIVTIPTRTLGGPITVQLNGMATTNRYRDDDPDAALGAGNGLDAPDGETDMDPSVAGVGTAAEAGFWLGNVIPSPAIGSDAWIDYRIPNTSGALALYDERGVKVLDINLAAHQGRAHLRLADVPAGHYTVRLEAAGRVVTRSLVVVR